LAHEHFNAELLLARAPDRSAAFEYVSRLPNTCNGSSIANPSLWLPGRRRTWARARNGDALAGRAVRVLIDPVDVAFRWSRSPRGAPAGCGAPGDLKAVGDWA
jgi:hypothetical protein